MKRTALITVAKSKLGKCYCKFHSNVHTSLSPILFIKPRLLLPGLAVTRDGQLVREASDEPPAQCNKVSVCDHI